MKRTILMAAALAVTLTGCANFTVPPSISTTPQAQLQAQWVQACLAYEGAQKAAIANLAHLSHAQLQQLVLVTHQITPLCGATMPADPTTAIQLITQSVTTLAAMEAVQAIQPQGVKK